MFVIAFILQIKLLPYGQLLLLLGQLMLPEMGDFCKAVGNLAVILCQALSTGTTPYLAMYQKVVQADYLIRTDHAHGVPELHLRIYVHALLVHVPNILLLEPLITGSSFSLEDFNQVWKRYLLFHTNNGGGKKTAGTEEDRVHSMNTSNEAGEHRRKANRHSTFSGSVKMYVVMYLPRYC
jgi:hypothetical protein